MNILFSILLVIAAYFLGSIPTAYLVGRWIKEIDLRQYGSGTVSGSGVWEHVAKWAVVPVGLFDVGKAVLPTWLGLYFDLGEVTAMAAGLAAVIGHNWPIFLSFMGGRGLGAMLGMWLILFWPAVLWMFIPLAVGWALGDSAPWAIASLLTLPIFTYFAGGPLAAIPAAVIMLLITIVKRLEANRRSLPPPGLERRRVLIRRLFFDRDVADHRAWLRRQPQKPENSE